MEKGYEEDYYNNYDIGDKTVRYLESPELRGFLASVARDLTAHFHPKTVLDAGCAMGVLVSEFVKQGVDAFGLDLSEYAVTHTDPVAVGRCFRGSLAETFPPQLPRRFDLVTCMEVVEHMSPEEGRAAIANLCAVTDTVIFCSTPDGFEDKTHINVQEREYWAACFAENGFFDDLEYRPLFLTEYAVCYRRRADWTEQVRDYERYIRQADAMLKEFRDIRFPALEKQHEQAVTEWTKTAGALEKMNEGYARLRADYDRLQRQLMEAAQDCGGLRQQNLQLQQEQEALRQAAVRQDLQLRQAEESLCQTTAQKEALSRQYTDLEEAFRRTSAQKNALAQRYAGLEETLGETVTQKDALSRRYADLEAAYRQCIQTYNETYALLVNVSDQKRGLETSASWRITAPVRWFKRRLKRWIGRTARLLFRAAKKLRRMMRRKPAVKAVSCKSNWPPRVAPLTSGEAAQVAVNCRRLGIYTIYDQDGIVDEYVLFYLKALAKWVEKLVVVSNGPLQDEGRGALEALGCQVLTRENKGFDAWGVKYAIEHVGFDVLEQYDEVVISNNTLFGPVGDLEEMFAEMSGRKVDFWGITAHAGAEYNEMFSCNPYGCLPEHIQSFFYVLRGRLLKGKAFRRFWTELPQLPDYRAAVGLYETVMTRYFSDAGYTWDTYMDRKDYYDMTDNPLITMPMESIRDWNCPFFKRRAFFQEYFYLTIHTDHQSVTTLMQYLREETDYPMALIWENLIRTCHMSDLVQNMHLSYILDRENVYALDSSLPMPKAALFMHIYDHTMAPQLAEYASSLPEDADIYISTVSAEKKAAIAEAFGSLPNRVEIRVLPNRGRDVSALLTSFRDVVMNYDVACVTHDKKTGYLKPQTVGEGFAYMGYENILGGKTFVAQILQSFVRNPFLGLLYCPDPSHADFAGHIGLEWLGNYEGVKNLAAELKLRVPMDPEHPPMAPYGSNFWFRTAAMKPLFDKEWTYEDFPAEPVTETDGTIMHAIERIYPFVAQHAGYYSALLATADYAAVDIGNLSYYAQQYAHTVFETGVSPHFTMAAVEDACGKILGPTESVHTPARPAKSGRIRRLASGARRTLKDWAELM